ncbi:MAG TPA: hypothetical protein VI248_23785 [Kineosporiaceae bacterium]
MIFTVVVLFAISIVVTSLLTYASTSLVSFQATTRADQQQQDVAGALNAAITDVRNSDYFNNAAAGQNCLGAAGTKTYPASGPHGATVVVTCAPDPGSGAAGGLVPVSELNKPSQALLLLGNSEGLTKAGNSVLRIHGSVYSNSTIAATGGNDCSATPQPPTGNCNEVYVDGATLTAEGTCGGPIYTLDPANTHCGTGTHLAAGDDPGLTYPAAYAQPTGLVRRTLPTCAAGTPLVTFQPGLYDDAVGLTNMMNGAGSNSCRKHTFWFSPGVYFFDFHNSEMPASGSPVIPQGSDLWTASDPDAFLIGGTRNGWTTQPASVPGACVSPLTSTGSAGVEFVFGGDSRLEVDQGKVELCGTWSSNKPPIVVYGAKSPDGATSSATLTPNTLSTNASAPKYGGLSPETDLATPHDGDKGPKVTGVNGKRTVTLGIGGFAGLASPIGQRAVLTKALLTVRHAEKNADAGTSMTVTLTPNVPGASPVSLPLPVSTGSTLTYRQDPPLDFTSLLAPSTYAFGLGTAISPLSAQVTLNTANSSNAVESDLDYMSLTLEWKPISFREQASTVTSPGSAAVIATNSQGDKQLYLQGTAYLPRNSVNLTLNNVSGQVFRSGLVARAATLNITASNTYTGPVIELPDNALAPKPLEVYLTAWICPPDATCTGTPPAAPWRAAGRTRVKFTDSAFTPVPGSRQVTVRSWVISP